MHLMTIIVHFIVMVMQLMTDQMMDVVQVDKPSYRESLKAVSSS